MATSGCVNRQQQEEQHHVVSRRSHEPVVATLSLSLSRKAPLFHSISSTCPPPCPAALASRSLESDLAFPTLEGKFCAGEANLSLSPSPPFRSALKHVASSTTPTSASALGGDVLAARETGEAGNRSPAEASSAISTVRLLPKRVNKSPASGRRQQQRQYKQRRWSSAAISASISGGAGARQLPSIADLMTAILRRNSAVPALACSSLSALGNNHVPNVQPNGGGGDGDGGGGGGRGGDDDAGLCGASRQKRVLILMSDTGGGHRASAEALKSVFEIEYGDQYKVFVIDLWKDHTPWPFNQLPKSYSFLVKNEYLWKFAFHASAPRLVHEFNFTTTGTFIAREIAKAFTKYQPDVIVSVHPLMQHVPLRILRSRGLLGRIPFTTVITDLNSCHPTWFHKHVTVCFAPNQEVGDRALKAGLKASQVRVHGLPIRPDFAMGTKPKERLREELGMDLDLKAVLLVGGGEGMGPVEVTARALAQELAAADESGRPRGQLIVVCGRNRRLATALESVDWPIPVQVKGFVTNMSDWMGACDCIITKAGPGTIAESLIRGLPMILNDYIAGQEAGNIPFVVDNGAGIFIKDPGEIARTVKDWFGPRVEEFKAMAQNCLKMARPKAVFEIVRDLHVLAQQRALVVEQPQFAVA